MYCIIVIDCLLEVKNVVNHLVRNKCIVIIIVVMVARAGLQLSIIIVCTCVRTYLRHTVGSGEVPADGSKHQ